MSDNDALRRCFISYVAEMPAVSRHGNRDDDGGNAVAANGMIIKEDVSMSLSLEVTFNLTRRRSFSPLFPCRRGGLAKALPTYMVPATPPTPVALRAAAARR
jgi:hypothetical protein